MVVHIDLFVPVHFPDLIVVFLGSPAIRAVAFRTFLDRVVLWPGKEGDEFFDHGCSRSRKFLNVARGIRLDKVLKNALGKFTSGRKEVNIPIVTTSPF